jgi:hypothetical protein
MTQWKSLFKLLIAIAPAVPIMLGIVLRMGWLAAAGVIAYLALILAATLIRVSRNQNRVMAFIYSSGRVTRLMLIT